MARSAAASAASTASVSSPLPKRSRLWLALALLFVVLRSLPNLAAPMGEDQATFGVIGRGLLEGRHLYRDLWDIKPPGMFWLYAPVVKLFGATMWPVGLIDILWLLAISYCIFRFAERCVGTDAAVVAVVVNAAWHCRAGYVHAGQPETFIVLIAFLAYFLVAAKEDLGAAAQPGRWIVVRLLAGGFLLGAACWLKYNVLVFAPLVLLVPYLDRRSLDSRPLRPRLAIGWGEWAARAAIFAVGLAVPVLAGLAYFWRAGLWTVFRQDHLAVVSRYGASAMPQSALEFLLQPLVAAVVGLGAWTCAATIAALVLAHRRAEFSRLAPILAGEFFGFAAAAAQFRLTSYEFETAFPFAALVWGYLAVRIYQMARDATRAFAPSHPRPLSPGGASGFRLPRSNRTALAIWILLAAVLAWPVASDARATDRGYLVLAEWLRAPESAYANYPSTYSGEHLRDELGVIDYLKAHSRPQDPVYVWGTDSRIYYLSGLSSPSRFVPNHPLMATWGPAAWRDELVRDLSRRPPAFIVVARHDAFPGITLTRLDSEHYLQVFSGLNTLISQNYQPVASYYYFVIYRHRAPE